MQRPNRSEGSRRRSDGHTESSRHVVNSHGIRRTFNDDSWVEVSSRPSSSSLSSAAEEIITTGLRVQQDPIATARRRRRVSSAIEDAISRNIEAESSGSEEEDVEEDDSEHAEDPTVDQQEQRPPSASSSAAYASAEISSDDSDEKATAMGIITQESFAPRPNAFSLPQTNQSQNQHTGQPYPARPPYRPVQRHSFSTTSQQHTPFNHMAPSHQVDHDAALRASLSTLLSYANAARSLPKGQRPSAATQPSPGGNRIEVTTLGLVRESVALGVDRDDMHERDESNAIVESKKPKRKAEGEPRSTSKDYISTRHQSRSRERASKKNTSSRKPTSTTQPSTMNMESVSPTLLTWIVGAGMIVLVSAISFSAGYVVGREAGSLPPAASGGGIATPNTDEMSESVSAVAKSLTGNVSSGGAMRRNLASQATGGAVSQGVMAGLGWGSVGVGAAS